MPLRLRLVALPMAANPQRVINCLIQRHRPARCPLRGLRRLVHRFQGRGQSVFEFMFLTCRQRPTDLFTEDRTRRRLGGVLVCFALVKLVNNPHLQINRQERIYLPHSD